MNTRKYSIIYWGTIVFCIVLLLGINLLFYPSISTLLWFLLTFAVVVIATFLIAFLASLLPVKFYEPNNKIFHVFKFEKKLYERLGIKKWKDKIPELGKQLSGFDKHTLAEPDNPEYIHKFLLENCKGDFLHAISMIYSVLSLVILIFILPYPFILTMWLPTAVVAICVHSLSYMILRYTRPKLMILHKRLTRNTQEVKTNENK